MDPIRSSSASGDSLILTIRVKPESKNNFIEWQSALNEKIANFPGFISLEILSPSEDQLAWVIVQRFVESESVKKWRSSKEYRHLLNQAKLFLPNEVQETIQEELLDNHQATVTEVFVTEVNPEKETIYREWIGKIHQLEATFPGFRGTYVQSPTQSQGKNWITLLQFDTPEHLDQWLKSPERQRILQEGQALMSSLESHRVASPFGGWFASVASREGKLPPAWKQSMIVLLVLFPIVMLEFRYLSPLTATLNLSLGTFIGNAISVGLITWPTVPIAIWFLRWWLAPQGTHQHRITFIGTALVILLYLIEIALFW